MEITINGIKTNYQVFGEGKPFLFLHGWGSKSDRWVGVAELVAKNGFKVIVPDLPGSGKADSLAMPWNLNKYVNWVDEFVKELNLGEFYLLGHSFGGAVSSKIAIKHAQEVKKLFLVSAAVVREKTTKKSFLARVAKFVKLFSFLPYYWLFRKAVYKYIIRKSDYSYVEGIMKQTYLNIVSEDPSFQLPFIKVATIIIWGEKDELTPIKHAYIVKEKIKNSKLIVVPGVMHDMDRHKNPQLLAEKILQNI